MRWYGQWNPPSDEVLFRNYFEAQSSGTFLECGAADGVSFSCCKAFEDMGWKGINIEGKEAHFKTLLSYRPNSVLNLHAALSDRDGQAIFRNEVVEKQLLPGEVSQTDVIRSICISTAIEESKLGYLDLLCLDIEGYEPVVLTDMMNSGTFPKVICVEYPHCTLRKIHDILSPKYSMDGISFNNAYFSLPDVNVKRPFWGRTAEVFLRDGGWVFPEVAEF